MGGQELHCRTILDSVQVSWIKCGGSRINCNKHEITNDSHFAHKRNSVSPIIG